MAYKKLNIAACALALLCAAGSVACATPAKKIKITVGMLRTSSAEESALFEECKRGFEKDYPQYEIVSSPYVYSADTVTAKFTSGQLPTVFEADASEVVDALSNGFIRDVSGRLKGEGWYNKIDKYFLSQISADGRVCGVPAEQNSAVMVLNLKTLYGAGVIRKDDGGGYILYDDGKAAYPDTFDEIEAACKKISERYGGAAGLYLASGDDKSGRIFSDIIYNFGSGRLEREDGDGNLALSLSSEPVGNAMRWVKNMAQLKYVDTSERYRTDGWAQMMSEGETGFAFCRSNALTANLSAYPALGGEIAIVPMPVADGEQSRSVWGGTVYAVSGLATDEQTEGAFAFLKYSGFGPDTDEQSTYFFERRIRDLYEKSVPIIPTVPVWNDDGYAKKTAEIYSRYSNVNAQYYSGYLDAFDVIKISGEPFGRTSLYITINDLFEKMLFEPTTSNIVTLLEESEKSFNEKYFKKGQ